MSTKRKNYLISILVTNFNKAMFLKETLMSIKKQTHQNFEIIIFDDCSTDNSLKILKKFKIKNKKIIINKKKFSTYAEINQINGLIKCFKASKGKIICLLDADDKFNKTKLSEIYNYFNNNINANMVTNQISNNNSNFKNNSLRLSNNWPRIYPTSCLSFRKKYFQKFISKKLHENFNLLAIVFIRSEFFLLKEYLINLGVLILFFIKIFFEISLSIAIDDAITPEWVYGILYCSRIV